MLIKSIPKFKISFIPYSYTDPLSFNSNLTSEELSIKETASSYA